MHIQARTPILSQPHGQTNRGSQFKIPKKSNSAVWDKSVRPIELQDDEIFDELDR